MSTSLHLLRLILAACLLLATLLPLRAENWQTLEIRVPPGRAPHTFALETVGGPGGETISPWGIYWPGAAPVWLQIGVYLDTEKDYALFDETAGDSISLVGLLGGSVVDLRASLWDTHGALPRLHFVAPGDRASHTFLLHQPGGVWMEAAGGSLYGPYDRQFSALYDPAQSFRIVDTTTNEMAPWGLDYLTGWEPNDLPVPEVPATFWLDAAENGYTYTFHSRAAGGTERLQSLTARPGNESAFMILENVVHAHSPCVQGSVGYGMEFWLTRDADGFESTHLLHAGEGYAGRPAAMWALPGAFPPLPVSARNLQTVHFRINGARSGHTFSVIHSDTYSSPVTLGDWGWVGSYDANGNCVDGLNYIEATAQVDMGQTWWYLYDQDGTAFQYGATDIFDGWQPLYSAPPVGSLSLSVFSGRLANSLTLRQFAADGLELRPRTINTSDLGIQSSLLWFTGSGEGGWYSPVSTLNAPIDLTIGADASDPGGIRGFSIRDEVTGEDSPFVSASSLSAAAIDLSTWYTPPVDQPLTFSNTRWYHRLVLHHPSGDEFPVINGATLGDTSWTPSGYAWWGDYGIFSATAKRRDLLGYLGYWIIDYSTGESSSDAGPGLSPTDLGGWVSHDAPLGLTATTTGPASILLSWWPGSFTQSYPLTGYEIRRQTNGTGAWQLIVTVSASPADYQATTEGMFNYTDTAVAEDAIFTYRVQGIYAEGRTLPSNEVSAPSPSHDTDGDGLPDWWEIKYGLLPNNPSDAGQTSAGGGMSNQEKYNQNLDPTKADTDGDGVNDASDAYPHDPKRSRDLAVMRYAAIDVSSAVTALDIKTVALDDQNTVAFAYEDSTNLYSAAVRNGNLVEGSALTIGKEHTITYDIQIPDPDNPGQSKTVQESATGRYSLAGAWGEPGQSVNAAGHLAGSIRYEVGGAGGSSFSRAFVATSVTPSDIFPPPPQPAENYRRPGVLAPCYFISFLGNSDYCYAMFYNTCTVVGDGTTNHWFKETAWDNIPGAANAHFSLSASSFSGLGAGYRWDLQTEMGGHVFWPSLAPIGHQISPMAINDSGTVLGHAQTASDSTRYMIRSSDGGDPLAASLPAVFKDQIRFPAASQAWTNNNGDMVIGGAEILEGSEALPVWTLRTILWRKSDNAIFITDTTGWTGQFNNDLCFATVGLKPILDTMGHPVVDATGNPTYRQIAQLLVPVDLVVESAKGSGQFRAMTNIPVFEPNDGVGRGVQHIEHAVSYRILLSEDLSSTAVDEIDVDLTNEFGTIQGHLTETTSGSGTFRNAVGSIIVQIKPVLTLSPSEKDSIIASVTAPLLKLTNSSINPKETTTASNLFEQLVFIVAEDVDFPPSNPDDKHDGVFYYRFPASFGGASGLPVRFTSGDTDVTVTATKPAGKDYLITPPLIALRNEITDTYPGFTALRLNATDRTLKMFLPTMLGVDVPVLKEESRRPAFLGVSLGAWEAWWALPGGFMDSGPDDHTERLDETVGARHGWFWHKKPHLGYFGSRTDDKLDIDELKDLLPKHSIFYLLTHGAALNPDDTEGAVQFVGFSVWNNDTFWDNYDAEVGPSFISANLGDNDYNLVFINGCASTEDSVGGATALAAAFKAKNYVGWPKRVNLTGAATAGEEFFRNLDKGQTISKAAIGVRAPPGFLPIDGGLGGKQVDLEVLKADDSVIIDNTP